MSPSMRELLIHCPDGQIKTVPLAGERLSVGRSRADEISFPEDAGLSRKHFVFEPESDDWTARDLGPKTGELATKAVNAQRGVVLTLEGENLVPRAHKGDGFRISTAVRDRVVNQKTSILVKDAQKDDAFKSRLSIVEQKVHTMMAVPLQTKD